MIPMDPDDRRSYFSSEAEWYDLRWGIYTGFALAMCVFIAFVIVIAMT
jgi:hypothetical protein